MGPPSGALRECQPGRPRVPYRRMSNSVHHAQACIGSTRGQRDPLQLVELEWVPRGTHQRNQDFGCQAAHGHASDGELN